MKNLKFRAWDKQLKHFKYFDLATCLPCYADESQFVVQQWTGLFDKNQKEIYEGDIVTCKIQDAQTQFLKKTYAGIIHWNHSYFAVGEYKLFIMKYESFKVIGNIFENENLLTEE